MDPLSFAAGLIAVLHTSVQVVNIQWNLVSQNYGWPFGFFISLFLRDTANRYTRIEKDVLNGDDDEDALAFKQAVTDECNMIAVAGAIVAQVALNALSLPDLSSTHWVARALFLIGVTTGCLSVYYACVLQRIVGKLYRPQSIRDWLSRQPPPSGEGESRYGPRVSLPAVFIFSAPFTTVKVSIFSFLTGLAVYQGFTWTRDLDASAAPGDSHDVFIAFIAATGFFFVFFFAIFSAKDIESLLRFGRTFLGSGAHPTDNESEAGIGNRQSGTRSRKIENSEPIDEFHTRHGADRVALGGLAAALDAAAQAHIQYTEANPASGSRVYQSFYDSI